MMELLEPFQSGPIRRGFLAAIMIGFANGYLSGFVVLRKSSLTLGPLSHSVLPGIAVAVAVAGLSAWTGFLGALLAALFVGLLATFISRTSRVDADTALGVLYTSAFAGGILLIKKLIDRGLLVSSDLEHWLFGGILGLSDQDLWIAFGVSLVVMITLCICQRPMLLTLFEPSVAASQGVPVRTMQYLLTTLVVMGLVTSLQAVGAILSVALLVAPAAIVSLFANSPRALFWGGAVLGAIVAGLAVLVSYWADLSTGSTIVVLLGTVFLLAFLLSPRDGLIAKWFQRPHEHDE